MIRSVVHTLIQTQRLNGKVSTMKTIEMTVMKTSQTAPASFDGAEIVQR